MSQGFNYKHLFYFWVVAQEGGMVRAADRLNMSVQTVSSQVRELEKALGHTLLKPAGRGLSLTEAGLAAMHHAEQIFQLGEQLPAVLREATGSPSIRLTVGISDGLPKLVTRHLMRKVLTQPHLRLLCLEDEFEDLLGDLALHRMDVVLSDRAAHSNTSLKLYSHAIGSSELSWYAPSGWIERATDDFPQSLERVPVLLPTHHSVVRLRLDAWFERKGIRPNIVGEFEDSALLKTFAAAGMGVFTAPKLVHEDLLERYGVKQVGECDGVAEHYFAIASQKKLQHPLVKQMLTD
jgi:LysR family transcriptional regulator, transcriptional activator of nhaA